MKNKAFSQQKCAEKTRKLNTIIRSQTGNLLDVEKIRALAPGISLDHQYVITVHPMQSDRCRVLVDNNELHLYIPEHHEN